MVYACITPSRPGGDIVVFFVNECYYHTLETRPLRNKLRNYYLSISIFFFFLSVILSLFLFLKSSLVRAAHPLLTLYICMDSAQQNSGMKEYYAMYLEALTLVELRKKLALKCSLSVEQIVGIYRYS